MFLLSYVNKIEKFGRYMPPYSGAYLRFKSIHSKCYLNFVDGVITMTLKALRHNMKNSKYCYLLKSASFADGLIEMLEYI